MSKRKTTPPHYSRGASSTMRNLEDYYERREDREGYCWCGCGGQTSLVKENELSRGYMAGDHRAYLKGHHIRKSGPEYLEEDRGHESTCWIWQLAVTKQRGEYNYYYGHKYDSLKRKIRRAHVIYYERQFGPVPEDCQLYHSCGVSLCVNPTHLLPLTKSEITRRSPDTKKSALSEADVQEIRRLAAQTDLTEEEIGARFNIVHGWAGEIIRGRVFPDDNYQPPAPGERKKRRSTETTRCAVCGATFVKPLARRQITCGDAVCKAAMRSRVNSRPHSESTKQRLSVLARERHQDGVYDALKATEIQRALHGKLPSSKPEGIPTSGWRRLRAHVDERLSYGEIAEQEGAAINTVGMSVRRAAARLAK